MPSSEYRSDCYTGIGILERVSIATHQMGLTYRMNFYRGCDAGSFNTLDKDAIFAGADIWLALVKRHAIGRDRHCNDTAFLKRLQALVPDMPKRELEVCAGIAKGVTSVGIALSIGLSVNTVLTYRKRAYSRLNISSQNELLKLTGL
jgi:DNA-binding CsgD family transcriptional regulator